MSEKLSNDSARMGQLILVSNTEKKHHFEGDCYLGTKMQAPDTGLKLQTKDGVVELEPGEEFYALFTPSNLGVPVRRAEKNPEDIVRTGFIKDIFD